MSLHQAYLWIGPENKLRQRALSFVQRQLCSEGGCAQCSDCKGVQQKQHYALTWLVPENYYTLAQLDRLFKTVCFALETGAHHFIVIERADLFNTSSANSLLKSLEEPPPGYHYILLAPRTEGILPTIRSRCLVEQVVGESELEGHRLVPFFTDFHFARAPELMKEIGKERVPEKEVDQLLDAVMQYWHDQLKQGITKQNDQQIKRARTLCDIITAMRAKPPMPGSSKLFLKNLYLRFSCAF